MVAKYSAGITSVRLWFKEFKQCLELYHAGYTIDEIKQASDDENIFQFSSTARAHRSSRNLTQRLVALPDDVVELFPVLDIENQKLVALLSMMLLNQFVNEFMYEVYRDELIMGDRILEDREANVFLMRKQVENEQVATWTEQTGKRVLGSVKGMLREAGLLERHGDVDRVNQAFVDRRLAEVLVQNNLSKELAALQGRVWGGV